MIGLKKRQASRILKVKWFHSRPREDDVDIVLLDRQQMFR